MQGPPMQGPNQLQKPHPSLAMILAQRRVTDTCRASKYSNRQKRQIFNDPGEVWRAMDRFIWNGAQYHDHFVKRNDDGKPDSCDANRVEFQGRGYDIRKIDDGTMLVAWPIRYKHCNNPYPRQDQWVDEREEELEEAEIEQDIPDDVSESYSMEFVYTMDGGTVVPELDQDELPLFGVEQHQIPLQPGDTSPEFIESKATDNDHASACTYGDSVSWSDQREDQAIDESFTEGTSDSLLRNSTPGSHKSIRLDPAPEDVKEDDQRLHSVDPEKVSEVSEVVSLDTEQQLRKQRLEEEDKAKVLVTEVELEPSGVSESRARHVHADPSMVILEDQIEATTPANIPMVSAKAVQITVPLIKPDGEQKTPTLPTTPSRKLPSQSKMDELKTKSICLLERLQRDCSSEVEKVKSIQACNSMRTRLLLDNSIEQQRDDYEALENIVKIHSEFYVKKLTELFDDFTVDNC